MTFEERHRPRSVQDLVFADPHVAAIVARYAYRRPSKPLLLYGAPGTGKSEALRLIAQTQFAQAGYEIDDFTLNGAEAEKDVFNRILNNEFNYYHVFSLTSTKQPVLCLGIVSRIPMAIYKYCYT